MEVQVFKMKRVGEISMDMMPSDETFRILVENSVVGVYIISENKFTYVNQYFCDIFSYTKAEILGKSMFELIAKVDKKRARKFVESLMSEKMSDTNFTVEVITKIGELKYVYIYGSVLEFNGQKNLVGTLVDATEKTLATKKLEYLANYDSLTGLFNRYYFNLQFERLMSHANRYKTNLALILFDIDNFKRINDSLGHKAGDSVLIKTAKLVKNVLRDSDYFFRIGGDEFTIIMENFHSSNEVKLLIKRIQQVLKTSIEVDDLSFHISLSIGVSLFPEHGKDIDTLQKSADIAMYRAKKDGKNRFSIFDKDSTTSTKVMELENELYEGIERGELLVYLQPQVDINSDSLIGAEALVRWNNPKRGVLTPNLFLPLAQEVGLMYKLDLVMIENTFLLLKKYDNLELLDFNISVNISNALFHHQRFFSIMQKFQKRYTYLCSYMKLELTEDILMVDRMHTNKMIRSLRLIGYKTAIDDFGTGYSSLSNLKMMEIDELKIDRSFIADITHDKNDKAIVKAIVDMGHTLDLAVLAEGAESVEQVEILREMGCDMIQGYYYDKPLPVEEFEKKWLQEFLI